MFSLLLKDLISDFIFYFNFLQLVVGSTVKVTKCSLHFDETDLSGSGVVVVQEVEITGLAHITQQQLQGGSQVSVD